MTRPNPNILRIIAAALAVVAGGTRAYAQAAVGSVSGRLITESGQPLPGVTAVYRRGVKHVATARHHSVPAAGDPVAEGTVTTLADGTFTIARLPVGNYSLCLDNPPALYVDHCAWNLSGAIFTVTAGTNTAMNPVTIISGVRVHFLLTDPQGLLPAGSQLEPVAHIGVGAPRGIFQPAAVASRSGGVTELVITVPHNLPVSTSIFSRTLKFFDSTGARASVAAVGLQPGATDLNIFYTVSN